jgi:hypothetical protein
LYGVPVWYGATAYGFEDEGVYAFDAARGGYPPDGGGGMVP